MTYLRDCLCAEPDTSLLGKEVRLCGWVHTRRDHGGLIFIDLRDHSGLVQLVFNPEEKEIFSLAESLRSEYVVAVTGKVSLRPEGTTNAQLKTGTLEILCHECVILNKTGSLPFTPSNHIQAGEDVRLKYRALDLRSSHMQENLRFRAKLSSEIRRFLEGHDFVELETPILTRSTPEGARDYLVPSRTHPESFFALPQSPQLFKQVLMVGGMDRYYQFARCFRDEDPRADRQSEFTQIDMEMAYVNEEDVMSLTENMIRHVFQTFLNVELPSFPRMSFHDAMQQYGSDKPDLRIPLRLVDITDLCKQTDFKVFRAPAEDPASRVAMLRIPGGEALSRKDIDDSTAFVAQFKAKGLAYIRVTHPTPAECQSPILKFLSEDFIKNLLTRAEAQPGDILFFGADTQSIVNESLGALRIRLAKKLKLVEDTWQPLWVTEFPAFEADSEGRLQSLHHPFTAWSDYSVLERIPDSLSPEDIQSLCKVESRAYDMVINGTEIGGGSVRIHESEKQKAVLKLLGMSQESLQEQFGFLLTALNLGAPPHGGLALGLDRLAMKIKGVNGIRDMIPFPKTQSAFCPLTGAPDRVSAEQLRDLHIKLASLKKEHGRT